jgi:uncharacterized protein YgbK (DUF1537 family)
MSERYVVLDDDPTGTQAVQDVRAFLRWSVARLQVALQSRPSIHLLTNARALTAERAEEVTYDAADTARRASQRARIVLRGDSTLRGHLLAEYRAVARAAFEGRRPALLLVPALPEAGRVTVGGVHYASSVPVHTTSYARDGVFSYRSSRLLEWADERTQGLLTAEQGIEVSSDTLRSDGPDAITRALAVASERGGVAIVPDVETAEDLDTVARGTRQAYAAELPVLVRASPAFAAVLTGTAANGFVAPPGAPDGLLIVCGSYVERTTAQLEHLCARRDIAPVEVALDELLGSPAQVSAEVMRAAREADRQLIEHGLAVLSTPRFRPAALRSLPSGLRVAEGLARILPAMNDLPTTVLAKGGITSQVTAEIGLGCDEAHVVGPVATGVALWHLRAPSGRGYDYLVFPGNVGDDDHLANVVSLVLDA